MIEREKIHDLVVQELEDANRTYPLFHSPHEAWAVLKEEVDELYYEMEKIQEKMDYMWVGVKNDMDIEGKAKSIYAHAVQGIRELIQVAAMAEKINQSNLYGGEEK